MTKVEIVSTTQGAGAYEGLGLGEIVEAVARHGKIKGYGKLIDFLIRQKHFSPLEHVHFTFKIETARDISAQMMRHRSFHWQELSQRYDVIQEFMPVELRKQGKTNRQVGDEVFDPSIIAQKIYEHGVGDYETSASIRVQQVLFFSQLVYNELLKAGVARECARRLLPMCAKTTVHMTGNLRDFMGYLNVRCQEDTQKEHREVAIGIGELLEDLMPDIFGKINWRKGNFM